MTTTTCLMDEPAFLRKAMAVLQRQAWEAQFTTDGPQEHFVLTYTGTGAGAPRYVACKTSAWGEHFTDWEPVATIHEDGTIRPENISGEFSDLLTAGHGEQ